MAKCLRLLSIAALMLLSVTRVSAQDNSMWKITEAKTLSDLLGGIPRAAVIAPDGSAIAWLKGGADGLCLYHLDSQSQDCHSFPKDFRGSPVTMAWSPDSSRLAFTENFFINLVESDVWVFNVATSTFQDRTDDGVTGSAMKAGQGLQGQFDYLPTWDPATGDLYFFRSTQPGDTRLFRLPATGDSEQVIDLSLVVPHLSIFRPATISPDGKQMGVIVLGQHLDDPLNGVWTISLSSGLTQQVVTIDALQIGLPAWQEGKVRPLPLQLDWAGNDGLMVVARDDQYISRQPAQNIYYVDLAKDAVTPLVDFSSIPDLKSMFQVGADDHSPLYTIPRIGVMLPDGKTYLYLHFDVGGDPDHIGGVSSVALPPDGSSPAFVGSIPNFKLGPPDYSSSSANGWVIMYNQLLKIEQG